MNAGKRDLLIRHILEELRVMRGLAYTVRLTVRWVAQNGILRQLNPWQNYWDSDRRLAREILATYKF